MTTAGLASASALSAPRLVVPRLLSFPLFAKLRMAARTLNITEANDKVPFQSMTGPAKAHISVSYPSLDLTGHACVVLLHLKKQVSEMLLRQIRVAWGLVLQHGEFGCHL